MEYIVVETSKGDGKTFKVFINGEENGVTGAKLTLGGSGYVMISVPERCPEEKTLKVEDTTINNPMIIKICQEKK